MDFRLPIADCRFLVRYRRISLSGNWQWLLFSASFILGCGCASPVRTFVPSVDPTTLDDASFLHYLATVPTVSVDEGLRGVLLLDEDGSKLTSFEERLAILTERGAVKAAWRLKADRTLDHGTLAYMLTRTSAMRGSVSEFLSRPTGWGDRRYALKSCIDEGLFGYALPHEPVSGGQFVAALSKTERLMKPPIDHSGP